MKHIKQIKPAADDIGQRLDRYLRKIFPGAKLGEIYEALRTKKITISGKKLPESTRLRDGDVLEIHLDDATRKIWEGGSYGWGDSPLSAGANFPTHGMGTRGGSGKLKTLNGKLEPSRILYEDSDLLIYNKPAGLIVHSPDHKTNEVSLIDQIEDYLRDKGWKPSGTFAHPALAHRIDRDTSGIIISCLTRKSFESMAEQFKTRKVQKTYHALVNGIPEPKVGTITAPLLRLDTGRTDEAKMIVDPKGDNAETTYKTLFSSVEQRSKSKDQRDGIIDLEQLTKINGNGDYSLIELHPRTGRTHQIRVHMAHIGNPLIGDKRYGGPSLTRFPELMNRASRVKRPELSVETESGNNVDSKTQDALRSSQDTLASRHGHLLHASGIEFTHPTTGEKMVIELKSPFFAK